MEGEMKEGKEGMREGEREGGNMGRERRMERMEGKVEQENSCLDNFWKTCLPREGR